MTQINHRDHILLTGGTGFFGKAVLRHWMNHPGSQPRISILSRNPQTFINANPELSSHVDWLQGDILTPSSLPWQSKFTHILHAAADSTFGPRLTPIERFHQIVTGTQNMLDFAVATGASRFLLTSSGAVYGEQPESMLRVSENYLGVPDPLDSKQAYGFAKRVAEHLCALYQDKFDLNVIIARCFAFVGPDLPRQAHFAMGNFIHDALHEKAITVKGTGNSVRSYMDQRDLAHWLTILLAYGRGGEAYNVGSDEGIRILDLAHRVRDLIAPHKAVFLENSEALCQKNETRLRYIPSIEKTSTEFKLTAQYSLDESILSCL